ncbi:Acetyltransferase (GNAT) domain [Phytophthora infestans]|uniref:Acetyltransferase (GNAT) domain n=1 Tax=Phytophthora infestans TaxID=4787 RepID=A0A833WLP1_PHYIN|nr:Acetyltransferase (GNAT) domain [Phytophthora infestans]KAF4137737.1 Acetyltransferase (GNAT) domain [Phytophthora infestans]
MKANEGVVITGQQVTLVPYEKEHVSKYHNWMKDPWLQEMTASEPLSIEEEFEMQKSWREDAESASAVLEIIAANDGDFIVIMVWIECTFIVLASDDSDGKTGASYVDENAINRMAGDVNLFFNDYDDPHACEMEIMIAEEKYRRKGFAMEAVKLMMAYATSTLHVTRFICKIIETNQASIQLFEKLGYVKYNYVAAFNQVELELVTKDKRMDTVLESAVIHTPQ